MILHYLLVWFKADLSVEVLKRNTKKLYIKNTPNLFKFSAFDGFVPFCHGDSWGPLELWVVYEEMLQSVNIFSRKFTMYFSDLLQRAKNVS